MCDEALQKNKVINHIAAVGCVYHDRIKSDKDLTYLALSLKQDDLLIIPSSNCYSRSTIYSSLSHANRKVKTLLTALQKKMKMLRMTLYGVS